MISKNTYEVAGPTVDHHGVSQANIHRILDRASRHASYFDLSFVSTRSLLFWNLAQDYSGNERRCDVAWTLRALRVTIVEGLNVRRCDVRNDHEGRGAYYLAGPELAYSLQCNQIWYHLRDGEDSQRRVHLHHVDWRP